MSAKTDHGEPKPKSKVETREEDFPQEKQVEVIHINTAKGDDVDE